MRRTPLLAAGLGVPLSLAIAVPGGALAVPEAASSPPARDDAFFLTEPSPAPAADVLAGLAER